MSIDKKSSYYDAGGIETINVIRAKLTTEQFKGWLLGNVIKYSCRLNYKGSAQRDAEKVQVYSKLLRGIFAKADAQKYFDEMKKGIAKSLGVDEEDLTTNRRKPLILPIEGTFQVASQNETHAGRIIAGDEEDIYIPDEGMVVRTRDGGVYLCAYIALCHDKNLSPDRVPEKEISTEEQADMFEEVGPVYSTEEE